MSAIYKEGVWYGGAADAEDISIKIGQNDLGLAETVQNIVEDIAPIETNSTNATNSYNIGDLLTHNGILYRVINNIAVGDQLVEGTNITKTTITQGVDLTNRVVALENKTQKITQATNEYLNIGENVGIGTANESKTRVVRVTNQKRDISLQVSTNAGIWDYQDNNNEGAWMIYSNTSHDVYIPHNTYITGTVAICGSSANTSSCAVRAQNKLSTIGLLASASGRRGVIDVIPDKWLLFVEASSAETLPNTIKTGYPFYLNSTTVQNLTSRGAITGNSTLKITGASTLSGATTVDDTLKITGATTVDDTLKVTGTSTFAAITASKLTSSGEILTTGSHLSAGTSASTAQHVCRVRNKYRNLQLTTGSSTAQAGIYDNGIISGGSYQGGGWMIYSDASTNTNNVNVTIPHRFHTNAASVSSLFSSESIIAGTSATTSEVKCCTYNKGRRIYMTTGNTTNKNAGLYDDANSEWILRSASDRHVYVPHPFTTTTFSAEGNATIQGTLLCRNTWSINAGSSASQFPVVLTSNTKTAVCGFISTQKSGSTKQIHVGGYFAEGSTSAININASSSDRRLKENIKITSRSGLELINKLDVVEFDWKDGGHWNFGIIAQDAGKVDKNIVPGIEEGEKEDDYFTIDTLYLVDVLVKATQELSAQVTELKEKIKILEGKIN